jgi:hypothetical protein
MKYGNGKVRKGIQMGIYVGGMVPNEADAL